MLLVALLALPLVVLGWRAMAHADRTRRNVVLALRTALLVLLVVMLSGPHSVQRHERLTVIGVVDVSGSVKRFADLPERPADNVRSNIEYLRWWFREATGVREPDDRFGLIAFDGQAIAVSAPITGNYTDDNLDISLVEGTDIADALQLAMAMFPPDTNRRIVLVSDGNQTSGNAMEIARQLQSTVEGRPTVPVDIVPIEYRVDNDAQIVRVEAPSIAQPEQIVALRIVMETTRRMSGRLTLLREGEPVDLEPDEPGLARSVPLPAGQSVHRVEVALGDTPLNRFEAIFEPDAPGDDAIIENNRAEAFTATPSRGRVVIVDSTDGPNPLADTLREAGINVSIIMPQQMPDEPLSLQAYELVILNNVAAYEFTRRQHTLLGQYVDEFGGGLIMVGGRKSFGAGGWTNTDLAQLMPVDLDPPKELRRPTSAIALVLDSSGSMTRRVAGARGSQQQVANEAAALAVESMHQETYVTVIDFDHTPHVRVAMRVNDNPIAVAEEIRRIAPGGGTHIEPALRAAHAQLSTVDVKNKHIVLLTDGQSNDRTIREFVTGLAAEDITVTTIGVGDEQAIDRELLEWIAEQSGGQFYHARDPRTLPRVLSESVSIVNRPLLKEGEFQPIVRPTGSALTVGLEAAPPLDGIVITAPRDNPLVSLDLLHPDGDPLLASWQAGLGRVAAFTSDASGIWSQRWLNWSGYNAFWTQLARTIARPAMSRDAELHTVIRDGRLQIDLEMFEFDRPEPDGAGGFTRVEGTVYTPDGNTVNVRLREVAPGRFEASIPAPTSGNYIVAIAPRRDGKPMTPVIGGASQAAGVEYRRYESDIGTLREVAALTGGRELNLTVPTQSPLFDRSDLEPIESSLPAWRSLLWLVLIVMLADIASRRVAWSGDQVRAWWRQAIARLSGREARGEAIASTLGALRQVSQRDRDTQQTAGDRHARSTPTAAVRRPTSQQRAQPDQHAVDDAIANLRGTPSRATPPAPPSDDDSTQPSAPAPERSTSDDDNGPKRTAHGLRAAKRRAQRKMRGEDDDA